NPDSISVVVPCFNEDQVIEPLISRLSTVLLQLQIPFEIVLVDDGSSDSTWELLRRHQQTKPYIKIIRLSRNQGQQLALTCGLDHTRGEVVVIIDADLQDPPELIGPMIEMWKQGY